MTPTRTTGYIGVDLDGTLAHHDSSDYDPATIGEPVAAMLARVQAWLAAGVEVRIITARVGPGHDEHERWLAYEAIEAWLLRHVGRVLTVTCQKDRGLVELWDDRAVQVEHNTGVAVVDDLRRQLAALKGGNQQ